MRRLARLVVISFTLILAAAASRTFAGTVSLAWDPVTDSDLAGYRVYYGTTSGNYTQSVDVGNVTTTTMSGLNDCTTYYFGVKAYDTAGNESLTYSNQISGWSRPVVTIAAPSAAEQGRALSVVINGNNFQSGATVLFSATGITVNSVTVNSCTQITANVTVGNTATVGASNVEVTNPDTVFGTGTGLFTVQLGAAPTIASTNPANSAIGVSVAVDPTITFSEPMLASTITTTNVRLLNSSGTAITQAAGSPSLSPDGLTVTISPSANLAMGGTYRIQVVGGTTGVKDLANRSLAATVTQSPGFTTAADTTGPVISAITETGLSATGATIGWTTDETSDTQVFYRRQGVTTYSQTTLVATLVTTHSQALTGLTPATTYEYYVRSADSAGNATQSAVGTFATTADTTGPVISAITETGVGTTGATIGWTTDEASDTQVFYRRQGVTTYSSTALVTTLVTTHSQALTGLTPGTTYEYYVRSADLAGNATQSAVGTFATTADTTGPVISAITETGVGTTGATIGWTTNEASDTQVFYRRQGVTTYSSTALVTTLVTTHSQALTGLTPGTTYEYYVRSADLAGNATQSAVGTFATTADTTGPVISAITETGLSATGATIGWTTDETSDTQVFYRRQGVTTYSQTTLVTTLVTTHSQVLTGLTPATTYEYYVRSADSAGNATQSAVGTFLTTGSGFSYLRMEAEAGALVAPVRAVTGATGAFGNSYIDLPAGTPGGSASSPSGTATFGVNIPTAGTWYLWVLLYGVDANSDSWFESVNGASRQAIFANPTGVWTWEAGRSYTLPVGLASIELGGRNALARADRILITNDATFVPSETPSGDQTPPASVSSFAGVGGTGTVALSWTNPTSSDFTQTIIRVRTDGKFPTSPVDGTAVTVEPGAPGSGDTYNDTGLTQGATYSYSAFSVDSSGNVGLRATVQVVAADASMPAPVNNLRRTDKR